MNLSAILFVTLSIKNLIKGTVSPDRSGALVDMMERSSPVLSYVCAGAVFFYFAFASKNF